jgi:hypothetical protein
MELKGKWIIPVAGTIAAILIIWGFTGEGTARKLLPEKEAAPQQAVSVKESKADFNEESGPVMKYDAARYRRAKPLADPFHAEAIAKAMAQEKKAYSKGISGAPAGKASAPGDDRLGKIRTAEKKHSDIPVLKGILAYRDDRRAILEIDGMSMVVKEGERAGLWTVSHIGEKNIILTGAQGTLELGTR